MTATPHRWVLHVDLDQFIAAVEVLRRPELAGRPVVVGGRGDPSERGVVATASYEAREFGIRSGMPLRTAARKCPDAVFLPADGPAYDAASAQVMQVLRSFEVPVEVLGWDEAFLGVETDDPEGFAADVRAAVLEETGLHCSVGIGDNKVRAKNATDLGKPRGAFRLTEENWFEVMGDRPTQALWGVGPKTSAKLAAMGVRTVAELAATPARTLADRLGPTMGPWYRRLGRGADSSAVDPTPYVPRGHGRETTFQRDLTDWEQVADEVRRLARRVLEDVRAEDRPAVRVGLKVRYAPFETRTRSTALPEPTTAESPVLDAVTGLLDGFDRSRAVRLLGVRLEMAPPVLIPR
ncbi:DNA polymerase IV [Nocardioides mesophilus]|uniref:DNA polymerase IV n=1 Tax=Nocardioides mesophilus TaxID=433659 RepID=A0A7G9R9Z5_9ACTN|nr:DNA polymerase IV [Nocardioides mesophilus]QNN52420.1 DNA polymerase IV [Nocardioides mesophilus]